MKTLLSTFVTTSLFATGIAIASANLSPANALPSLQLDILGGTYDASPSEESVVTNQKNFTLYAYCLTSAGDGKACDISKEHFVSVAVIDNAGNPVASSSNFGSFVFGGTTYGSGGNPLVFGNPPLSDPSGVGSDPGDLPSHGIYDTLFSEVGFLFNPSQTRNGVNVQTNPGTSIASGRDIAYIPFQVDISGLSQGFDLHFDLYSTEAKETCTGKNRAKICNVTDIDANDKAPFSHDARTKGRKPDIGNPPPEKTPEPGATVALGLIGAIALGVSRRKRSDRLS